jgi:hypothetical protein
MLGLREYPLKLTVTPKNPDKCEAWTLGTITSVGGTGASIYAFLSGDNPVKYTDPDGRTPRASMSLMSGYAWVHSDYLDPKSIKGLNVFATEGMQLTLAPATKIQMQINGIEKKIEISNKSGNYFTMDVNASIDNLVKIISPLEATANETWAKYGELGMEAMGNLIVTGLVGSLSVLNAVLPASEYIPLDFLAQPIGESLAGNTPEDFKVFFESLHRVIDARIFLKEIYKVEIE